MKLIDFDGLFEKKIRDYMQKHAGRYTEEAWEEKIPVLYARFGDTYVKAAGNTPRGYYAAMDDETLAATLSAHVVHGVPVSDFLRREAEKRGCTPALLSLMQGDNEDAAALAVELSQGDSAAFPAYFALIRRGVGEDTVNRIAEFLCADADEAAEGALACYRDGVQPALMLEVLSHVRNRDERIFTALMQAFRTSDDLCTYARDLACYGDERALPALLEALDREDIDFLEFREIKCAVETLGGRYERERDFSDDPYYEKVQAQSQELPDFTGDSDAKR